MLDASLNGKKLLLLGGIGPAIDLVELAHRNGVFVGVADYNSGTKVKEIADAAYEVNALDEDAIVSLYKKEKYDGIISNFNDMLSPYVARIAARVGAYSPYSVEQLKMSTDKKYFKDTCIKFGIPVPKEYKASIETGMSEEKVEYPVIVKPVDGSGSKGISICVSEENMEPCLKKAAAASRSGDVIVEEYLPFDEINVTYIAQDGDIQLAAIHDRYFNTSQENAVKVPDMYIYPSKYTDTYIEKYNEKVIHMFEELGIRNGSFFLQAVVRDCEVFFYEAGMRLNGCKTYQILERENGYNTFEHLMQYALTGTMGEYCQFDARMKHWYATWNVVGSPGATCVKIIGESELKDKKWLVQLAQTYYEGETIPESARGTLIQLVARIHVAGETADELLEHIDELQSTYKILDEQGQNILMKPHDIKDLREHLNCSL